MHSKVKVLPGQVQELVDLNTNPSSNAYPKPVVYSARLNHALYIETVAIQRFYIPIFAKKYANTIHSTLELNIPIIRLNPGH